MQQWVDADGIMFSQALGANGKPLKWMNLGDWCAPETLPPDNMVHTFYFWRCADLTAQSARALGKQAEADRYARLADATRRAFWKRFYDAEQGTYGKFGGNIFALKMGVPDEQYPRVIAALKADIQANSGHLDTGIFGTQFFFEVLSEHGMHDLAHQAISKRTWPSYGFWLEQGATTSREKWDDGGSHNHPMFGGGIVWFYRKLAGMNADPEEPGYRHIVFRPQPVDGVSHARYANRTPYGTAGIAWKRGGERFTMEVTVPVGSTATAYVPTGDPNGVTESGIAAADANGVRYLRSEDGYAVFTLLSGGYAFETP